MKTPPKIGTTHELQFVVEPKHLIDFATGDMPAVLSTPNLIAYLERTAREALARYLEDSERSVGMEIELRHFAPTPPGQRVTCIARVIGTDGSRITFQVEARDEWEVIARGLHRRGVIQAARFTQVVRRKMR